MTAKIFVLDHRHRRGRGRVHLLSTSIHSLGGSRASHPHRLEIKPTDQRQYNWKIIRSEMTPPESSGESGRHQEIYK